MHRNREDEKLFKAIALKQSVTPMEVRKIVFSYFDAISADGKRLPFDDNRKIYDSECFEKLSFSYNIPYIGRIGPVYSRYLKWRGNVAKELEQVPRASFLSSNTRPDIEQMAEEILSGKPVTVSAKRRTDSLYNRVWLVGTRGKRLARQVMPKTEE